MRTFLRWTVSGLLALAAFAAALLGGLRYAASRHEAAEVARPAEGRMVPVPGGGIYVQIHGAEGAPPVLLVHGTAAWSGFWASVGAELGRSGHRVIAVDLPPFGFSDRRADDLYTRRAQGDRLAALISALGLARAVIVGHSFGAGPVVETALRHPDKVSGLVLVDGALGLPDAGADYPEDNPVLSAALHQPLIAETFVAASMTNSGLTHYLLAGLLNRKEAASERQIDILRLPMARPGTTPAFARWLPELVFPDRDALSAAPQSYARMNIPTALIWGREDSVTPLAQGERLRGLIPGATLDVIDGAGHIPHIEDEAAFLALLKKRLGEMAARR